MLNKKLYSYVSIQENYEYINNFYNGLAYIYNESKISVMNSDGTIETPFTYYYRIIDKNNNLIILHNPLCIDNLISVLDNNGKFGFINKNGDLAIKFKYDDSYNFQYSRAAVKTDNKWGYINKNGEVTIPIIYEKVGWFINGLTGAIKNNKLGYIDTNGKMIIPFEYDYNGIDICSVFNDGLLAISKDGKKGYIDNTGKIVIKLDFEYDKIGAFSEGFAGVMINKNRTSNIPQNNYNKLDKKYNENKLWGLIDITGKLVLPVEYDNYISFSEGIAIIKKGNRQYYIDSKLNILFNTNYDELSFYLSGIARVKKDDKIGFIDKKGSIIMKLNNSYDFIHYKNDIGYFLVKKDDKYGYIDINNKIIVPIEYDSINYSEGLAVVYKNNQWGIIKFIH